MRGQRKTHIQERVCQDTRGMRGKARRADRKSESRNRRKEEGNTTIIKKRSQDCGRPIALYDKI